MKTRNLISFIGLMACSLSSYADTVQCTNQSIERVTVEASRDDGFNLKDMIVITLKGTCNGEAIAYLETDHVASLHFLQIGLAAKTTGSNVRIAVNSSAPITNNTTGDVIGYELAYLTID